MQEEPAKDVLQVGGGQLQLEAPCGSFRQPPIMRFLHVSVEAPTLSLLQPHRGKMYAKQGNETTASFRNRGGSLAEPSFQSWLAVTGRRCLWPMKS